MPPFCQNEENLKYYYDDEEDGVEVGIPFDFIEEEYLIF